MIPMDGNKHNTYHQHVLLDVMIELWHMMFSIIWMFLKLRLYHIQCANVTIGKKNKIN